MKAAWALGLAAVSAPGWGQAYQCTLPDRIAVSAPPQPDGPVRRTPIAGYTLAISWAPEFCRGNRDPAAMECNGRNGRFGFVLHGLWPESRNGPPPQWCALTPRPSLQSLRANACMSPFPRVMEHEWAKHGSCMAPTPGTYFASEARLWNALQWPDADRLSRQRNLTVGDLRDAVMLGNPGWPRAAIGVGTNPRGWLSEVRLCYSRRFTPIACARRQVGPPDTAPLRIWRGL